MIECKRYRIRIYRCAGGGDSGLYCVSSAPIEFVGKEEFRRWAKFCRRNFMVLTQRWVYSRFFESHEEAVLFAGHLAKGLGEFVFLDMLETHAVAPRSESELELESEEEEGEARAAHTSSRGVLP